MKGSWQRTKDYKAFDSGYDAIWGKEGVVNEELELEPLVSYELSPVPDRMPIIHGDCPCSGCQQCRKQGTV